MSRSGQVLARGTALGGMLLMLSCVHVAPASANAAGRPAATEQAARAAALLPVGRVRINTTSYAWGSAKRIASYVRNVYWVQTVVRLANLCPNAQAYFFISRNGLGAVGWIPASVRQCVGVEGGGPSSSPCAQARATPNGYYVVIAGSNPGICRDLSTQVPGGVLTKTRTALSGLPAGSTVRIKCQIQQPLGLADYITRPATSFPGSKTAWWVYDTSVFSGSRWSGVPSCWGTS
jgi:hypothetical protein